MELDHIYVVYSQVYSFFLNLPILARLVLFNFVFKSHKRILNIIMDSIVAVATMIWLILVKDVYLPLGFSSSIVRFSAVLYIILIADLIYNYYRFKKLNRQAADR